jgi:pyruvate/2-oxoglutarate dehydrogenase complex dihydrolipoamide dehydrogenase (E3) component
MWAIGREAETKKIGLDKAGVQVDRIGKIHTVMERTNVPHIYAIGDIIVVRFFFFFCSSIYLFI